MKSLSFLKQSLETFQYNWSVYGGFACYYYKVRKNIPNDLDIIIMDEDNEKRKDFLEHLKTIGFKVKNSGIFFNDVTAALTFESEEIDLIFTKSKVKSMGIQSSIKGSINNVLVPVYNKVFLAIEKYRTLRDKDLEDVIGLIKTMNVNELSQFKSTAKKIKDIDYESLENIINFVGK